MEERLELAPSEVLERMKRGDAIALIDVREPEEFALAHLEGSELIPMQSVPAQVQRIEAAADTRDLAVICHHGVRSLNVVAWLRRQGIDNCFSVAGGIDRWSREVDPGIPRY